MKDHTKILVGLFVLLLTAGFAYWQWDVLSANKSMVSVLGTEVSDLTTQKDAFAEEYQAVKTDTAESNETLAQDLLRVFPPNEDITNLTRLLDDFAVKTNFENNPFFISSIRYGSAETPEGANYRVLPISLEITTSAKNLSKFLEYVESSGSLEAGVRLMSAEEVTVSYPSEYGGTFEVQIDLNAYFAQSVTQ
ncbi:MAG: hypothetical protein WC846_03840 [Candidatus Gracilibacteria bacterium]|jgi:Tfp pilus assembly protein PilO